MSVTMTTKSIESKWQELLRFHFPGVIAQWNRGLEDEGNPWLDVFMVPDARMAEFARFFVYQAGKLAQSEQLPDLDLISHSVSTTRAHYPEIWREARSESSHVAKSSGRKSRLRSRTELKIPIQKATS